MTQRPAVGRRTLFKAGGGAAALGLLSPRAAAAAEPDLPSDAAYGTLEQVHAFRGAMPTGVTVSATGRVFVCYPRWGDVVPFTVGELRGGREVAYPSAAYNRPAGKGDRGSFVSVQSVVVDPLDRLWVVDAASPAFTPTVLGGPKLVRLSLETDTVEQTIVFPRDVVPATSYLNDVRFDLRRGRAGLAFLTDSSAKGPNGIVVVDLATGECWRRLADHPSVKAEPPSRFRPIVEGRPLLTRYAGVPPKPLALGSDGIAISADGERLFYCPLVSRTLYSVSVDALADRSLSDAAVAATVRDEGDKGSGSDGLETDSQGRVYLTAYEQNAVLRRERDGDLSTVVHDPRLLWPDTLSLAQDGFLYVIANQLHRQPAYSYGVDRRRKPYSLFRTPVDAGPVLLR